jgi:predicted nucleic acid-binding protein
MTLAALDMMIAIHAIAEDATLITSDTSFEPQASLTRVPARFVYWPELD